MKFFSKLKESSKKRFNCKWWLSFLWKSIVILVVISLSWIYFQLMVFNWWVEKENHADFGLARIMKQAMRQPSTTRYENLLQDPITKTAYAYHAKDSWLDLEPITTEEWMNVDCKSSKKYSGDSYGFDQNTLDHMYCINPIIYGRYPNKNAHSGRIFRTSINTILSGMFDSPCISVSFNEYILNYPKIFNNIIKIAEKPCVYLKGKGLRDDLYCDKSRESWYEAEKSCVVINIFNSEGYKKMQLRIPRQDNKHLLKGQKEWDIKLQQLVKRIESYSKK
jgi:hypothetical protein